MRISENVRGHETHLKEQSLDLLRCSTQMYSIVYVICIYKKRIYIYIYIDNIDKNNMDPMSAKTTPRVLYSSQAAAGRRACGSCTGQSGR